MRKIDVCFSPDLIHLYDLSDKCVVVVDIFRATSCMVTAFAHGAAEIVPVEQIELCQSFREKGYLISAERNGITPEGFDFDNSPFSYQDPKVKGAKICVTTTNGTVAIRRSAEAPQLYVGAFLNLSSITEAVKNWQGDALVVCAGWKGKPNLEDTLFAGAVINRIKAHFTIHCDSSKLAENLFLEAGEDRFAFMRDRGATHYHRLTNYGLEKDIRYCLTADGANVLPIFKGDRLVVG